ncbi:MAG: gliding-motility protein MglA [Deferribacteres bacterium]|nr:gliding-motility protein MglA [candidate division KSB1 bacterium]MCB9504064.1 gliding-motility protein MglA [Deferribacteres bacterium]
MVFINWAQKEINLKIVYYGPGLSGKTTNLEYIYSQISPACRGELVTLKTREERTLYFDFLQVEFGNIKGLRPKFNLYTIPGQIYYTESRRIILRSVDGVVFVADSQRDRMDDNLESLLDLEQNLNREDHSLEYFPWILQLNKQDLASASATAELQEKLNFLNVPTIPAIASRGAGVLETLKLAIQSTISHVHETV